MKYVRIYADERGESHFEDVDLSSALERSSVSSSRSALSPVLAATGVVFRDVVQETGDWHPAPRRQFVVHLRGEAQIEVSDGETRRFGPGSVVLVDDLEGKGHRTTRIGDTPRRTLFIRVP